jgi:pimeloyl-ACP methyl ester carboxylesterase
VDTNSPSSGNASERRAFPPDLSADLRGATRLVVDAIVGVADVVEAMHRTILGLAPIVGPVRHERTTGIPGLVYRSVRGLSRLVGGQLDAALRQLAPLPSPLPDEDREAVVAALNGILGDHLVDANNPLAIPMQLRTNGHPLPLRRDALRDATAPPNPKLLVLVHGLCMSDRGWSRDGHNHGSSLARALGHTPLSLRYNSGRSIPANGRRFADLLETLIQEWPVPVRELVLIGHSMGGLVARSACHYARLANHTWPRRLNKLVFLGTPHHGSPLEKVGSWVDVLESISPYTAPLARIGKIRSDGIKDLRYGTIVDDVGDWDTSAEVRAPQPSVPLPKDTQCFAIAATMSPSIDNPPQRLQWDGLVPVKSALGRHTDPTQSLSIPSSHQRLFRDLSHFDLLSSRAVYDQLHDWLSNS